MAAAVTILEFTDPGCPWAYSAEPFRRRLDWIYGEHINWQTRMVGLASTPEDYTSSGFDTAKQARAFTNIAREHEMPIDTRERERMAATVPACRAVIAARLNAPEAERAVLRSLRVQHFSGELLDQPETIERAAVQAGLDPDQLASWCRSDQVSEALEQDMSAARQPIVAARALDHKLANWSGGRRYTCPSYELVRESDGVRIAVPGFQPFATYDVVLANLAPLADRREDPADVAEVLSWAGVPLATKEVAVLCGIGRTEARERLGRVATERHVGADGFWSLQVP
ncbi:MAG: DsbA family protein [Solirubrobacteraceae bacterium]